MVLPNNTVNACAMSFLASFSVGTLLKNPATGLTFGAFACTATLIHQLLGPLFRSMNNNNPHLSTTMEMIRGISAVGLTAVLAGSFVSITTIDLIALAIIHAVRLHNDWGISRNVNEPSWIFVV